MSVFVHDHFMANDHGFHELIEMRVSLQLSDIFFNILTLVYLFSDGYLLENHFVGSKGARLVC